MHKPIFQIINYRNKIIYLYDTAMNELVEITTKEWKSLLDSQNYASSDLDRLTSMGYLKEYENTKIEHPLTPYVESIVNQYSSTLILQVTQNCNFSCRYCSFANTYGTTRNHEKQFMSFETAQKAILFLKCKSQYNDTVSIYFYGGEPLLNYNIIKKSVIYAKETLQEKDILFGITTNLSVLSDAMIDFFIHNNIFLTVSLDGPKKIHDKYRKMSLNGEGSFDIVYNNLNRIRKTNNSYFDNYVSINAVVEPSSNINLIQSFFDEDVLLKNIHITYNQMVKENNDAYFYQSDEQRIQMNSSYLNYLFSKLIAGDSAKEAVFAEFNNIENISSNLNHNKLSHQNTWHHNGPCVAGYRKIFVNVKGDFFPCENVNELNNEMKIGDIYHGYDYEKIVQQLNVGLLTKDECANCWARNLCFSCQKNADDSKRLSRDKKIQNCINQKKNLVYDLKLKIILTKIGEYI